jgi:hypothetical protein
MQFIDMGHFQPPIDHRKGQLAFDQIQCIAADTP